MSALALDIGTYTLKAVAGNPGSSVKVERTAEMFNTLGVSVPTDDANAEKFTEQLQNFFDDNNLPRGDIRISLPESAVSTKVISIPPLSDAELASAIGWQAEQHIPIPLEELSLEYKVVYRPPGNDKNQQMRVLLVGVRKQIIERFMDTFLQIGVEPTILESQALSIYRSLQFTDQDPTSMIVHLGAATMDLFIVHEGQLAFVFSHLNGGNLLTRAIEQGVGLDTKQAEQYKRTYGIDETQFEGKIAQAMAPSLKILTNELQKAFQFFVHQYPGKSISRVLLSGGTAQMPGLVQHVTSVLGVEVLIASPFAQASGELPQVNHTAFTVCMGLLMRGD